MSEMIYTFAALAARHKDGATCDKGMRLLADTLHPYGVKITWIVSVQSAHIMAKALTEWHEAFGDDVALCLEQVSVGDEGKKAAVAEARDALRQLLPWSSVTVAGAGHTDSEMIPILEELGFEGLWGFCWEQIEVDDITDRGCPWGVYYIDRDERLRPARGRGLVAMEWTSRDLLKSFHSGNPCLYSTDPNDVARGGICSWEDISYWKGLADNYRRNTRYNEHVFLLQHQEAHEQERSDLCRCYTEEDIREGAVMLEEFVKYVKDDVRMMTLPEAAAFYRKTYAHTPSSYMLWEDTPTPPCNPDYVWSTSPGPWPKTFLYHDRDAQMMFIEGKVEPVCIRNYRRPWRPGEFFAERDIPKTELVSNSRLRWRRELEIKVTSPCAMPYGLALWGDFALYQIDEAPGLIEGKILSRELLFLRYDVAEGESLLRVKLSGK